MRETSLGDGDREQLHDFGDDVFRRAMFLGIPLDDVKPLSHMGYSTERALIRLPN
jgi:hypothetical protein